MVLVCKKEKNISLFFKEYFRTQDTSLPLNNRTNLHKLNYYITNSTQIDCTSPYQLSKQLILLIAT